MNSKNINYHLTQKIDYNAAAAAAGDHDDDDGNDDDVSVFARMTLHAYSAHCALEASPLSNADHHHTSASSEYIVTIIIIIHQHHQNTSS